MKEIEQKLRETLEYQLRLIEYSRRKEYALGTADWSQVRCILEKYLLTEIANTISSY